MTIHWKAVEQYFTVVLFVNPLAPRVLPWVIQSFLTFQFNPVCYFGLGTVRSEMVKISDNSVLPLAVIAIAVL